MVLGFDCYYILEISTMLSTFTVPLVFEFSGHSVCIPSSPFIHLSYSILDNLKNIFPVKHTFFSNPHNLCSYCKSFIFTSPQLLHIYQKKYIKEIGYYQKDKKY